MQCEKSEQQSEYSMHKNSLARYEGRYKERLSQLRFINSTDSTRSFYGNEPCPICYTDLKPPLVMLSCGHGFCKMCFSDFQQVRDRRGAGLNCPICNQRITGEDVRLK